MVKIKRKVVMTKEEYAKYLIDKYGVVGFEGELIDNNIIDAPMKFKQTFELNPVSKSDLPNGSFRNREYTVEVEEEITEDTFFKHLIRVTEDDEHYSTDFFKVRDLIHLGTEEIHAYIDGEYKLIWTHKKGLVE